MPPRASTRVRAPRNVAPAAPVVNGTSTKSNTSKKRKSADNNQDDEPKATAKRAKTSQEPTQNKIAKRPKTTKATTKAVPKPSPKVVPASASFSTVPTDTLSSFTSSPPDASDLPVINKAPTEVLTVFAFGTGDMSGELGLGPKKKEAKRAIAIPKLDGREKDAYRVVQLDCGGMHIIALTEDNKIVTWGGNDKGALGRDTNWDGGLRDMDAEKSGSDSDSDDESLNPVESTPTHIPESAFPKGTKFTSVAAGDSCSFAVTDTGLVYGWGTFLDSEAHETFLLYKDEHIKVQHKPTLIPHLQNITKVVCGSNHALALDIKGNVWTWGVNEQNQVGRRARRTRTDQQDNYYPAILELSRHPVKLIASGPYHSFAVDKLDRVFAWGLNSYGQAGYAKDAGSDNAILPYPLQIRSLSKQGIVVMDGGEQHTTAVSSDGRFLVWGRIDGGHLGLKLTEEQLQDPKLVRRDEHDRPRILLQPAAVPNIGEGAFVACSRGHTIFVNKEGKAYASGFNGQLQLGNGTDDDTEVAEEVKAKALKGAKLTWCGTGGQFSMVAGPAAECKVEA
ncbi:hypothetical protein VSDG_07118 [Cytospora chrysosperma]|uniref:RCC1-like domain-containing protein n=1 Tax=Cytospora chrysosperma TaxID=252740 RepID=A0A423VV37_CYTCH|nr:hypothetical protein VSDG_07118 [Valsa sordida]